VTSTTRRRHIRLTGALSAAIAMLMVLPACASVVDGSPVAPVVQNANLPVEGDSHTQFDTEVKNAISDVRDFWRKVYPSVANGAKFPEFEGKLYSVDGKQVLESRKAPASAANEECMQRRPLFVVDNAAYCQLDDSIIWDRSPQHLVPALASSYGAAVVPLVFAHEVGHAVQQRLGLTDDNHPTVYLESQADCAAGAFLATALAGKAPHFKLSAADLDKALVGFLQIRDSTPDSPEDISHGNGFDRVSAVGDGIAQGVTYCFSDKYFDRTFTERPYVDDQDRDSGGNISLQDFLASDGPLTDLNRFWKTAGQTINSTFSDVKLAEAAHPKCGAASAASEIGYCPEDNTVYYSNSFAALAYNSIVDRAIDTTTGNISLVKNRPGDFALGMMFAISWGMAARHQFFQRSVDDRAGLLSAICYSGAYAKDINLQTTDAVHKFILSPPDMDEATSAVLNLVELNRAFSARGTTGVQRIQSFVTGYGKGLSACT
jgi:predicted metalloprotease